MATRVHVPFMFPAAILRATQLMSHAPTRLDRRTFLHRAVDACAFAAGVHAFAVFGARARSEHRWRKRSPDLRVGVVVIGGNDAYATSSMGVELGIDEAKRAASLLGGTAEVVSQAASIASARMLLRRERLSAMICASAADDMLELERECAGAGTPLFNVAAEDDSLRNERCSRIAFHVIASNAMRQSALRALAGASAPTETTIETWHSRLERFGAAQLNDRFRARFHRPMDSLAWAGWFAMKAAWEASLRARAADGTAIGAYLARDTTHFDGQKGVPLSFRHWDHQLRQPLYAIAAQAEPVSIPASSAGSSRGDLDALGSNEAGSACRWR